LRGEDGAGVAWGVVHDDGGKTFTPSGGEDMKNNGSA